VNYTRHQGAGISIDAQIPKPAPLPSVRFRPILLKNSLCRGVQPRTKYSTIQNGPGAAIVAWLKGQVPPKAILRRYRPSFSTQKTDWRLSLKLIHGGKADFGREAVRSCADLPTSCSGCNRICSTSAETATRMATTGQLSIGGAATSRREIDNL
jgi:hypothetical protein